MNYNEGYKSHSMILDYGYEDHGAYRQSTVLGCSYLGTEWIRMRVSPVLGIVTLGITCELGFKGWSCTMTTLVNKPWTWTYGYPWLSHLVEFVPRVYMRRIVRALSSSYHSKFVMLMKTYPGPASCPTSRKGLEVRSPIIIPGPLYVVYCLWSE